MKSHLRIIVHAAACRRGTKNQLYGGGTRLQGGAHDGQWKAASSPEPWMVLARHHRPVGFRMRGKYTPGCRPVQHESGPAWGIACLAMTLCNCMRPGSAAWTRGRAGRAGWFQPCLKQREVPDAKTLWVSGCVLRNTGGRSKQGVSKARSGTGRQGTDECKEQGRAVSTRGDLGAKSPRQSQELSNREESDARAMARGQKLDTRSGAPNSNPEVFGVNPQ